MNLVRGGRKRSRGGSWVFTLLRSSAGSVTSSIWLNSECRANESLPDTMWLITITLSGAVQKFEIRNSRFEISTACRRTTFLPQRVSSRRRISLRLSKPTQSIVGSSAFARATADKEIAANVPWDLVILGDGPLRNTLNSTVSTLNLHEHVHLPGFKLYDELPVYYALANAFVHASTSEQWGLVVNEAIASGLPVIVSNRCGCAPELVNGNGFTFDPFEEQELVERLLQMASLSDDERKSLSYASYRISRNFAPERFGEGLERAASVALGVRQKKFGVMDRALLLVTASYAR